MKKLFIFILLIINYAFSMEEFKDFYDFIKKEYQNLALTEDERKEAEKIGPYAEQSLIIKACRKLNLIYHPDSPLPAGLTKEERDKKIAEINEICTVLKDPETRGVYNKENLFQLANYTKDRQADLLQAIKEIVTNYHILFMPLETLNPSEKNTRESIERKKNIFLSNTATTDLEYFRKRFIVIGTPEDEKTFHENKFIASQLLNILNQQPSHAQDDYFNLFNAQINKIRPENINNADQLNRALQNLNTLSTQFELELYIDQRMQNKLIDTYIKNAQKAKELNLEDKLQEIFTIIENKRIEWGALGKIDQKLLDKLNTLKKVSPRKVSAEPIMPTAPVDLTNISKTLQDLKEKLDTLSSILKKT